MSLATIVSDVAAECGYTVDSTVIGSTDTTTKQLLAIVQRVSQEMFKAYPWPKCYASGSITLVSGQATYPLPAAFSHYQYETFWNQSTRWKIIGPMTEQEYAEAIGFGLITTIYQRFQIRGVSNNELLIYPTPGATQDGKNVVFQYISERCVKPVTWTPNTGFGAGAYCFYNGNYYTLSGSPGNSGTTPPTWTSGTNTDGVLSWTYYNGPYNKFLADTDTSIFDERVLQQGVLERFAEIHGLESVRPRFEVQLNEEFSRENVGKVVYAGNTSRGDMYARAGTAVFGTFI